MNMACMTDAQLRQAHGYLHRMAGNIHLPGSRRSSARNLLTMVEGEQNKRALARMKVERMAAWSPKPTK